MILLGDCLERLKELEENSVDAVVTDPPYGLKFMGKRWDYDVPSVALWLETIRVLKPGGHLLSFGGTRTYHRLASAIEDAGFEIRDQLQWLYGSGFPKSLDISKAIDKKFGAEREVLGVSGKSGSKRTAMNDMPGGEYFATKPSTPEAYRYKGWGTALKPANEPIVLARKPLEKGLTVAENMFKWGVGGLNIDESRIAHNEECKVMKSQVIAGEMQGQNSFGNGGRSKDTLELKPGGRWPANLLLDETAAEMLDEQSGILKTGGVGQIDTPVAKSNIGFTNKRTARTTAGSSGGASRFFYVAKASKRERNAGLEGMPEVTARSGMGGKMPVDDDGKERDRFQSTQSTQSNHHPTVKPIKLMEYLCKLITPPGGVILDPFMGSGSTGVAAFRLGYRFIGIEQSEEYCEIARKRIEAAKC